MDHNYEKIWEAYNSSLLNEAPPVPGAPAGPAGQGAAAPAARPPVKLQTPPKPTGDQSIKVGLDAPAAPRKEAKVVSMTSIEQAPEVLKALVTLFTNPTTLGLIKKAVKDQAAEAAGESGQGAPAITRLPAPGSPGPVPGP